MFWCLLTGHRWRVTEAHYDRIVEKCTRCSRIKATFYDQM